MYTDEGMVIRSCERLTASTPPRVGLVCAAAVLDVPKSMDKIQSLDMSGPFLLSP